MSQFSILAPPQFFGMGTNSPHPKGGIIISPLKFHILRILSGRRGAERSIARTELLAELVKRLGKVRDREMRSALEELRRGHAQGAWICADFRGGHFLAQDKEELERYLTSDEGRAKNLLDRVQNQREIVGSQNKTRTNVI